MQPHVETLQHPRAYTEQQLKLAVFIATTMRPGKFVLTDSPEKKAA